MQECEEGYFVNPSFTNNTWECIPSDGLITVEPILDDSDSASAPFDIFEAMPLSPFDIDDYLRRPNVCPVNGFDICTNQDPAVPTPDTEPTENPLGICRCAGEYWVSQGCSYGWKCDGNGNGGEYKGCEVTKYLQFITNLVRYL